MHWATIGVVAVPVLMIVGAVVGGFWRIQNEFRTLKAQVANVAKEFKPNGGSSLKDDMNVVKGDLRDLGTRFDDHLKQHAGEWR